MAGMVGVYGVAIRQVNRVNVLTHNLDFIN